MTSKWRRNARDPRNVLRRYVTETAQMPTTPQKKNLGYVTLARNMPMPTPCFLVLVTLRSASCPSVVYTTVMKVNNFQGDQTDISAKKEALVRCNLILSQCMSQCMWSWYILKVLKTVQSESDEHSSRSAARATRCYRFQNEIKYFLDTLIQKICF